MLLATYHRPTMTKVTLATTLSWPMLSNQTETHTVRNNMNYNSGMFRYSSLWPTRKQSYFRSALMNRMLLPLPVSNGRSVWYSVLSRTKSYDSFSFPIEISPGFIIEFLCMFYKGDNGSIPRTKTSSSRTNRSPPRNLLPPLRNWAEVPECILNTAVYQGFVEVLSLKELCVAIDVVLCTFDFE